MIPQTIKTRGLHTGIRFAPQVALDKTHKQKFQIKANEGFDWQRHEYSDRVWRLATPQPDGDRRSEIKLTVQPDTMTFEDSFPTGPLEVFLDNLKLAMNAVADVFNPQVMLGSGTIIRMTVEAEGGDARVFLGKHCLQMDDRLKPLGRPVHGVGLKMLLPPLPGEGQPKWQATLRIESLVEDVRQLFIEVDARWSNPTQWSPQAVLERVQTAQKFATNEVIHFLQGFGTGGA